MHRPPAKRGQQDWHTVVDDLNDQRRRLGQAREWIKGIAEILGSAERITYSNQTQLFPGARSVDIVFDLTIGGQRQDVGVFSIVRKWSDEELAAALQDKLTSAPAVRQIEAQKAEESYGMKTFETWMVDVPELWQGEEATTVAWMSKQVSAWLSYWFGFSGPVRHRRDKLYVSRLGR